MSKLRPIVPPRTTSDGSHEKPVTDGYEPGAFIAPAEPIGAQDTAGEIHRPSIAIPRLSESTKLEDKPVAPKHERSAMRTLPMDAHVEYDAARSQPVNPSLQVAGQVENVAIPHATETRGARDGSYPTPAIEKLSRDTMTLQKLNIESGAGEGSKSFIAETVPLAPGESRERTLFGTRRLIPYDQVPPTSPGDDAHLPSRPDETSEAPWMNDQPGAPVKVVLQERKAMSGFAIPEKA